MYSIGERIEEAKAKIADMRSTSEIRALQSYISILENIVAFEQFNRLPKLLSGGKQVILNGGIFRSPLFINLPVGTTHVQILSEDRKSIYYYRASYTELGRTNFDFVEQLEVQ